MSDEKAPKPKKKITRTPVAPVAPKAPKTPETPEALPPGRLIDALLYDHKLSLAEAAILRDGLAVTQVGSLIYDFLNDTTRRNRASTNLGKMAGSAETYKSVFDSLLKGTGPIVSPSSVPRGPAPGQDKAHRASKFDDYFARHLGSLRPQSAAFHVPEVDVDFSDSDLNEALDSLNVEFGDGVELSFADLGVASYEIGCKEDATGAQPSSTVWIHARPEEGVSFTDAHVERMLLFAATLRAGLLSEQKVIAFVPQAVGLHLEVEIPVLLRNLETEEGLVEALWDLYEDAERAAGRPKTPTPDDDPDLSH